MKRLNRSLLVIMFVTCNHLNVNARFIKDYDLHLYFGINEVTREATVGSEEVVVSSSSDAPRARADIGADFLPENVSYRNIVIPSTITDGGITYTVVGIVSKAFYKMTGIETVTLPETIRYIDSNAFGYCISLSSINFPNSITRIGNGAFFDCKKLNGIHLPSRLESIGDRAFSDCVSLEEINIPGNCQHIGVDAFKGCGNILRLVIEDGTTPLQFSYNYEIPYDYESQTVSQIDTLPHPRGQFEDSKISYLYIGRDVLYPEPQYSEVETGYIRCFPFGRCRFVVGAYQGYSHEGPQLLSLEFGNYVTEIPEHLFSNGTINGTIKNNVIFPENLKSIGESAFCALPNTEIVFPETLESIASNAFEDLSSMQKLYLPPSLKTIGSGAFGNCKSLKELYIQGNIENIGSYAFGYKIYPLFVHSDASIPPTLENDIFEKSAIYVPSGTGHIYRQQWKGTIIDPADEVVTVNVKKSGTLYSRLLAQDIQIKDVCRLNLKGTLDDDDWSIVESMSNLYEWNLSDLEADKLPENLLEGNISLLNIALPKTLTSIRENLFVDCHHLIGSIDIPVNCHVGDSAFAGTNIENVSISESAEIGRYAFSSCPQIQEIKAEGNGISIESKAFSQSLIQTVTIGNGVEVLDSAFFSSSVENLYIEDGVESIGDNNFGHVKKQVFQGRIGHIGKDAFSGADAIYVSDITTWCNLPFSDADNITPHLYINNEEARDIVIPVGVTEIRKYLFHDCESLTSVEMHDGIIEVGDSAFLNCSQLVDVKLPTMLSSIKNGVFSGCSNLEQISLPSTLVSIGDRAFNETRLSSILLPSTMKKIGNNAFSGTNIVAVQVPKACTGIGNYAFASCSLLENVNLSSQTSFIGEGAFQNCIALKEIQLPNSLPAIEHGTFMGCSSLQEVKIPSSVSAVEGMAFSGCSNLKSVIVLWETPPTPKEGAFSGISSDCYLYTPIGTSTQYFKAGWDMFNYLKEAGLINIVVNKGGKVTYNDEVLADKSKEFVYAPYKSFNVNIAADDGYCLKKVKLNDVRIENDVEDGLLFIEEPEENLTLSVVFADENIEMGDVNGDGVTNVTDVVNIINNILKAENTDFHDWSADMNDDDVVNVTDAVILIHEILNESSKAKKR